MHIRRVSGVLMCLRPFPFVVSSSSPYKKALKSPDIDKRKLGTMLEKKIEIKISSI